MRTTVGIQKLILCAGVALGVSLAAAIAVWHGMIGSRDQRSANLTGVVQIGADGDMCQRFVIDHKTGFIKQEQRVACRETAKESGREAPRIPGVRPRRAPVVTRQSSRSASPNVPSRVIRPAPELKPCATHSTIVEQPPGIRVSRRGGHTFPRFRLGSSQEPAAAFRLSGADLSRRRPTGERMHDRRYVGNGRPAPGGCGGAAPV